MRAVERNYHEGDSAVVQEKPIQCFEYPDFANIDPYTLAEEILGLNPAAKPKFALLENSPPFLQAARMFGLPTMDKKQEADLFLKYNYCKHQAKMQQETLGKDDLQQSNASEYFYWREQAETIREHITRCNLAIVIAAAKKIRKQAGITYTEELMNELVEEGNIALAKAIDGFDVGNGTKFSTYTVRAIHNRLIRYLEKTTYQRSEIQPKDSDFLTVGMDREIVCETRQHQNGWKKPMDENPYEWLENEVSQLSIQRREIMMGRFFCEKRKTLHKLATQLGCSHATIAREEERAINDLRIQAKQQFGAAEVL